MYPKLNQKQNPWQISAIEKQQQKNKQQQQKDHTHTKQQPKTRMTASILTKGPHIWKVKKNGYLIFKIHNVQIFGVSPFSNSSNKTTVKWWKIKM